MISVCCSTAYSISCLCIYLLVPLCQAGNTLNKKFLAHVLNKSNNAWKSAANDSNSRLLTLHGIHTCMYVGQTGGRWVISKYAGSLALDGDPIILYFMVTKTGVCNCLLNGTHRPKESSMSSNTISISLFKSSTVAVPFLGVFCNLCNFIFHEYSVCEHSVTLINSQTN